MSSTTETIDGIRTERRGRVAILTLSNPQSRNAYYPEMRRRLVLQLQEHAKDDAVRAIVVTGEGKHFCTGADLKRLGARPQSLVGKREDLKEAQMLARAFMTNPKPIVAAVEGDAFGAGLSMVLASEFVVAAKSARFGAGYPKMGLLPDFGMLYTLPRRVGLAEARRMLMLGEQLDGTRALEVGLVDQAAADGEALAGAVALCERFDETGPLVIAAMKAMLADGPNSLEDVLRVEVDLGPLLAVSEEFVEARTAFLEKRRPDFTPKART